MDEELKQLFRKHNILDVATFINEAIIYQNYVQENYDQVHEEAESAVMNADEQ